MKLIVETPEGTREIDYAKLTSGEIAQRLRTYDQQYGGYEKFLGQYDCGASSFEDSVILMDWDGLLEEKKRRRDAGQDSERDRGKIMHEVDLLKKIIIPFLIHGICKDEAEALRMLAKDYVRRQVQRYDERVQHFRAFYQTSVERVARQVTALCWGTGRMPALGHLDRREQIVQAEDDLEEGQAAEEFLARWQTDNPLRRWDNAPHLSHLPNFPHHTKHHTLRSSPHECSPTHRRRTQIARWF
jgi:Family of unknown function (DUF6516)